MVDGFNIVFLALGALNSSLPQLVSLSTDVALLDCVVSILRLVESKCCVLRALADLDLPRVSANSTLFLVERFTRPITSKLCVLTESKRGSKTGDSSRISPSIFSDIVSNVTFRCLLDTTSDETPEGTIQGLKDFVVRVCEREKPGCEEVGLLKGLLSSLLPLLLRSLAQLSLDTVDLLDDILPFSLANNLGDRSIDDSQFSPLRTFLL